MLGIKNFMQRSMAKNKTLHCKTACGNSALSMLIKKFGNFYLQFVFGILEWVTKMKGLKSERKVF